MSDVIIVLARGINPDGALPPDPRARVQRAAALFRQGRAPRVLMSGSWHYQIATAPPRTEAAAMAAYARELGVPSTALLEETRSMDTLGNAYFTKVDVCRPHGWRHLLIVASDEHMERVRSIFTKVFGRGYALQFVESDRVLDVDAHRRAQANEALLVRDLMPRLDQIHDGDDVAIRDLLLQTIPAYRHRLHP